MNNRFLLIGLLAVLFCVVASAQTCVTIQSGTIVDVTAVSITTGFDQWGYNYQAMVFNGVYGNYTRPVVPVTTGDSLVMKWNSAWLSNQDCDGDHKLDRHYGFSSYRGSGAWLTNHQRGTYTDNNGVNQKWEYFVKIVAAPLDATLANGIWTGADGIVIGYAIWGDFAVMQEISNDTGTGDHGVLYKAPVGPGFGKF